MKTQTQATQATKNAPSTSSRPSSPPDQGQVSERARSLWQAAGSPDNRDLEFWFEAERQLGSSGPRSEEDAFADTRVMFDQNAEPNSAVERSIKRSARPAGSRGPTSFEPEKAN